MKRHPKLIRVFSKLNFVNYLKTLSLNLKTTKSNNNEIPGQSKLKK